MAEGTRRICDFDNDSFETLIHLYKPYLVTNLKVYDLVMSMMLPGRVVKAIMTLERTNQTEEAASVFLDALLQSDDPSKWSAFRDALNKPEHALIVDILERGVTDDLKIHDELQNVVDLFRKDIIEALDPFVMCQYLQQAELLTLAEAQKVQACQRQDGDSMANFLLMSYVPRNKDWYLKFMKIIWAQGLMELVRLIDPEMFEKLSAQEGKPVYDTTGESVHLDFQDSGETSVKVLGAPPRTSTESFGYGSDCLPVNLKDLQGSTRKSFNILGDDDNIFKHKVSANREKTWIFESSADIKQYNITLPAFRELSVDSNEPENMISLDENNSTHLYLGEGTCSTKSSKILPLNQLSPSPVGGGPIRVDNSADNINAAGEFPDNNGKNTKTNIGTSKVLVMSEQELFGHTNPKTSENNPWATVASGASPAASVVTEDSHNLPKCHKPNSKTSMEMPKLRAVTEDELFPLKSPQSPRNPPNNNATYPHVATAAEATPDSATFSEVMMKPMPFGSCTSIENEQHCPTDTDPQPQSSRNHFKMNENQIRLNMSAHNATVRSNITRSLTTTRYNDLGREPTDTIRDETLMKPFYIPSRGEPNNIQPSMSTTSKNEDHENDSEEIPAELVEQLISMPDIDTPPEKVNPHKYSQHASSRSELRPRHQQQSESKPKPKQASGSKATIARAKPQETKPKSPKPIKGGMSDGYYVDVACLADDDMAMHGAMLSNATKKPGDRGNDCILS